MEKVLKYVLVALVGVSVALVAWAVATTPSDPTTANATAVGANLYWGYVYYLQIFSKEDLSQWVVEMFG